jgi:hypothetical protein
MGGSQLKAKLGKKLDLISTNKLSMVVTCLSFQLWERHRWENPCLRPALGNTTRPYLKNNYSKKGLGVWLK